MAEQHHRVPARRPYHSPARQRQAEQTRAGILAAARDLFRSAGYAATTIDAIASSAQGWLARNLPQRKGLTRSLSSMLAARPSIRARRVQLACRYCGRVAAFVDEDPAGARFELHPGLRLLVRSPTITRRNLQSVSCPEHGRLLAGWTAVLPAAVAARDGRVRRLRLRPVSSFHDQPDQGLLQV